MLTNNKPWQAIVNANNLSKVNTAENNLAVVQKETVSRKQRSSYTVKVITPKRYSFDDNGGGYQGL